MKQPRQTARTEIYGHVICLSHAILKLASERQSIMFTSVWEKVNSKKDASILIISLWLHRKEERNEITIYVGAAIKRGRGIDRKISKTLRTLKGVI